MYIGLFDQDLLLYPNMFIPSLELMKYSFYYKKEKNIVKMFYDANESSPYDKIILNSNFNDRENFPKIMVLNPKVEWVGKTFFGGQYHRLPKEVEICEGDKSIYQSFFDKNKNHFRKNQLIRINCFLKNGSPYRLTHKGEIIFDCDKLKNSNKKLYLYDEEIFENQEIFDILSKYKNEKEIIFLESQRVEDFDLFIKINQNLPKILSWKDRPSIVYEGNLDFKTIDEVIDLLKNHTSSISFVGDGAIKNKEKLKNNFENCIFLEKNELSSYSLGLAGLNAYKNGLVSSLMPLYLRKSQAERSLEEKSKKE